MWRGAGRFCGIPIVAHNIAAIAETRIISQPTVPDRHGMVASWRVFGILIVTHDIVSWNPAPFPTRLFRIPMAWRGELAPIVAHNIVGIAEPRTISRRGSGGLPLLPPKVPPGPVEL